MITSHTHHLLHDYVTHSDSSFIAKPVCEKFCTFVLLWSQGYSFHLCCFGHLSGIKFAISKQGLVMKLVGLFGFLSKYLYHGLLKCLPLSLVSEFVCFVCHCFSSLVHHPAKYLTCLTEEIIVGREMFGFVTVMVMSDKCVFSEWELRFR